MITMIALSAVLSFGIVALFMPILIKKLRELKASQTERECLESHQAKVGTPTMGGLLIMLAVLVAGIIISATYGGRTAAVLILTIGFGIIGFLDDFLKVVLRRSDGLIAWQKFGLQFLVTIVFAFYLTQVLHLSLALRVPFFPSVYLDFGWFNYVILFVAVLGTVNGVNFTDGLDGLATTVTIIVAGFFAVVCLHEAPDLVCICVAVIGALLGFLIYNHYPAKIFMGDTGSLALGGFVAGIAYVLQMPLFIILVGLIYMIEVISVILQVGYFKLTHGKRIFRMAPIHHHFELGGWSEKKVVLVFSVVTLVMCVISYFGV
ncbi:MAG: phospho-N-acetylmuramoyl-pentapeptide-transferase [Lachnospiraceae bacterium]|nr:phospho-N-acetylmuramoyl-pentapeptide-transferase [Lachnospiraceae bacterium]